MTPPDAFSLDPAFNNGPCANCAGSFACHGRTPDGADVCLCGDTRGVECLCVAYVPRDLYTENLDTLVDRMTAGRLAGFR